MTVDPEDSSDPAEVVVTHEVGHIFDGEHVLDPTIVIFPALAGGSRLTLEQGRATRECTLTESSPGRVNGHVLDNASGRRGDTSVPLSDITKLVVAEESLDEGRLSYLVALGGLLEAAGARTFWNPIDRDADSTTPEAPLLGERLA